MATLVACYAGYTAQFIASRRATLGVYLLVRRICRIGELREDTHYHMRSYHFSTIEVPETLEDVLEIPQSYVV